MNGSGGFILNKETGYFQNQGVNVMVYDDFYPEGHQSGISILMHGKRTAANGDLRFEPTPGQFQPVPKQQSRVIDPEDNSVTVTLSYPDLFRHLRIGEGTANPMIYPDYCFSYSVRVKGEADRIEITVDLDRPVPESLQGKLCFNLELFPGELFGKPWIMDNRSGIFPRQPNGPTLTRPSVTGLPGNPSGARPEMTVEWLTNGCREYSPMIADDIIAEPYAVGRCLTIRPDDPASRITVLSATADMKLYDGRMNHNNGWFVVSSEIPAGMSEGAIRWTVRPDVIDGWMYPPVVQTSQVGYHPDQPKVAVIELDNRENSREQAELYRLTPQGEETVYSAGTEEWGRFLRYRYVRFDFSSVRDEGLYRVRYGNSSSSLFRIAEDVYDRGVWQPVLEYFLPIQMCHMRVSEKYRVWHDLCHNDDARMAPVNHHHFDGYIQGNSTCTGYQPGDPVPGLNAGGWHDAGDFDLRIESQAGECYILALIFEEFGLYYDSMTVDQKRKITEIHQPDGKNDLLEQLEHGMLSVMGAYRALGRMYRGIIANTVRQYVMLGDPASMTDNIEGTEDDRWVFTEDMPQRELMTAAQIAAASRALRGFNNGLSEESLRAARELYARTDDSSPQAGLAKIHAAAELLITTGEALYREHLLNQKDFILKNIRELGWIVCRALPGIGDTDFEQAIETAMTDLKAHYDELSAETPYGIPYRPRIWGAGWDIQRTGFRYYFLHKAFPKLFDAGFIYNSLNFILGCHPGSNPASFASGVGTVSATVAYGFNRAEWTYIPGGVISGTALIRPDFPELLEFPFLWQQTEYVMGGGSTHYMFLVLAAQKLLR